MIRGCYMPCAQARMILARKASAWLVFLRRDNSSNLSRSSSVKTIEETGRPIGMHS
jgi:hypothetical protein